MNNVDGWPIKKVVCRDKRTVVKRDRQFLKPNKIHKHVVAWLLSDG